MGQMVFSKLLSKSQGCLTCFPSVCCPWKYLMETSSLPKYIRDKYEWARYWWQKLKSRQEWTISSSCLYLRMECLFSAKSKDYFEKKIIHFTFPLIIRNKPPLVWAVSEFGVGTKHQQIRINKNVTAVQYL